jgi:hypothetical protein
MPASLPRDSKLLVSPNTVFCALQKSSVIELTAGLIPAMFVFELLITLPF